MSQLELKAEPDYLPLAEVVRLQRARIAKMEAEGMLPSGEVLPQGNSGNGSND